MLLLRKYTVSTLQGLLPKGHQSNESFAAAELLLLDHFNQPRTLCGGLSMNIHDRFLFAHVCYFPAVVRLSSEATKL